MAEKAKVKPRAFFIDPEGSDGWSKNPSGTTQAVVSEFSDHDNVTASVNDMPTEMQALLAWHGLKQLMGDSRASEGSKGESVTHEALTARLERLQTGDWVKEGERAGPRITIIVEAIAAAKEAAGLKVDHEAIAEKAKDKEYRDGAMANAAVKDHYDRIRIERMQAARKKNKDAAKEAAAALGDL